MRAPRWTVGCRMALHRVALQGRRLIRCCCRPGTGLLGRLAVSGFPRRPPNLGGRHYRRVREIAGFAEVKEFLERDVEGSCDDFELFRLRKRISPLDLTGLLERQADRISESCLFHSRESS